MKPKTLAYWTTTVLFCLAMGAGGVFDLTLAPQVIEGLQKLGYPAYLGYILGFWKVCGVIVLILPGLPLVKEWAYAGFVFNLTGASASHFFSHDTPDKIATPLVILAIGIVSYVTRGGCRSLCGMKCEVPEEPKST